MFLFKRKGYYHLEYFDEVENRPKRISTKCKISENNLNQILDKEPRSDFKDIYLFGFHSGCRINEILHMKWNAVDFANLSARIFFLKNFELGHKKNILSRLEILA